MAVDQSLLKGGVLGFVAGGTVWFLLRERTGVSQRVGGSDPASKRRYSRVG